jgi:hypothetical protein
MTYNIIYYLTTGRGTVNSKAATLPLVASAESWNEASQYFKSAVSKPGAPDGEYVVIQFKASIVCAT